MPSIKIAAVAFLLCAMSVGARGETALEVQSRCKNIANSKLEADGTILYAANDDSGFCWGAFAAIQDLSSIVKDNRPYLFGICPPKHSSRVQYVKIFSKFVEDHPEIGHQKFSFVALSALTTAFPCPAVEPSR